MKLKNLKSTVHTCEVYSSLKGYLLEISVFYQEMNALIETLKPVIKLPEYGLMPTTEPRSQIYVKYNILTNKLVTVEMQKFTNSFQSP